MDTYDNINGATSSSCVVGINYQLELPVDEDNYCTQDSNYYDNGIYDYTTNMSRNISWEYKNVSLTRVPGYGFGIAVSGGSDNPHFANGDPAIAISDVLKGGPAEQKLNINDRIITANGIKLENVDYGTAVQVLRDSGPTVNLIIKRRIINQNQKITLNKLTSSKLKNIQPQDYGINLQLRIYIKDSKNSNLNEGDEIIAINGFDVAKLFDFKRGFVNTDKLTLTVVKPQTPLNQQQQQQNGDALLYNHQTQPSYESSNGNLYVQPPTRKHLQKSQNSIDELLVPLPPPIRPPLPKENDVHLHPSSPMMMSSSSMLLYNRSTPPPPPPPPPPNLQQQHHHHFVDNNQNDNNLISSSEKYYTLTSPRYINFIKKKQLGIRLSGGNNVGIYISATQPDTPADQAGLKRGDRIIRCNDTEYNNNVTREDAIENLSLLKNDTIVSMIVRFVPDFEKILSETEFHDKIYYKTKFNLESVFKKNQIIVVSDTLNNSTNNSWQGYLLEKHVKVQFPNFKQAQDILKGASNSNIISRSSFRRNNKDSSSSSECVPYEKVIRKKISWLRPVVIYSNFTDIIYEKIFKQFPSKFNIVKSPLVEEIPVELRLLSEKGLHGLLQIKSVASYDKLSNTVCPVAIVVKTSDKHVLKEILKINNQKSNNNNNNYYSSLLRSFNKTANGSPTNSSNGQSSGYKKQSDELQKTEDDLGESCRVINITSSNDDWFRRIIDMIEHELNLEYTWVTSMPPQQQMTEMQMNGGNNGESSKIDLPNYNLPPPYAVHNSNNQTSSFLLDNHHHNNQPDYNMKRKSSHQNGQINNNQNSRHSSDLYQQSSLKRKPIKQETPLLAHSPIPTNNPPHLQQQQFLHNHHQQQENKSFVSGVVPPPLDRTKKPQFYSKQKPIPPPKPTKILPPPPPPPTNNNRLIEDDNKQSYYLNLPINSKSFSANKNSAFELYRKPASLNLLQNSRPESTEDYCYTTTPPTQQIPPLPLTSQPNNNQQHLPLLQENTTSGTFDIKGGILIQRNVPSNQIPIELRIPPGAIPEGTVQTIWFHAVPMTDNNYQLDLINGNAESSSSSGSLISPLIKFGPEGLRFLKPVEIRIPQYSKQSNASVLLGNEKSSNWSKINIQQDSLLFPETPYKIVSLTIQQL